MKKRRIFIIGLIVLLLACPSCMIYITVKQQDGYKKRVADNTNEYMLQFLTMAVESKTDPDYKPLNFNGLDEKSQEAATATMNRMMMDFTMKHIMKRQDSIIRIRNLIILSPMKNFLNLVRVRNIFTRIL